VYRPAWLAPLRFIAFTSTFCPMMALFGARRPQNREWKYIVWCLWIVLALPAGWALLLHPGRFSLEPLWAFFLLALIAAGTCNFLMTRYWPSSVLYGAGQVLLVADYLPWFSGDPAHADPASGAMAAVTVAPLAGQLFLAAALALARLVAAWRRRLPSPGRMPLDRLWIDFRDSFGAVWALRVAQRTNAAASMYNWNTQLRWDGFHMTGPEGGGSSYEAAALPSDTLPTETARAVERHLRSLLRRFVSPDWIDQRLAGGVVEDGRTKDEGRGQKK
jgi:hypothetical protein